MTTKSDLMHGAAVRVLERYQRTGEPFALFLSSWKFDEVRKKLVELLGQHPGNVQVRIGLERQVRINLKQEGLETVAVYRQGDEERIGVPKEWPSLVLSDAEWLKQVSRVASLADLIVLFWGVTTEGLSDELKICSSRGNRLKTVCIVNVSPRDILLSQLYRTFPRVVPLTEIPPMIGLHPEFTPLVKRMKSIKKLSEKKRSALVNPTSRRQQFPFPPTSTRFKRKI